MKKFAIILAADMPTPGLVLDICGKVGPIVDGIKIGMGTVLEAGKTILQKTRDKIQDKPLLLDLKIADIGFFSGGRRQGTNGKIIESVSNAGVTHITCHAFPGPTSVAEALSAAHDYGMKTLLLPLMSHTGAGLFFSGSITKNRIYEEASKAGLNLELPDSPVTDVTEGILAIGEALGADGYIGPATRPEDLKRYRRMTDKAIWCPGFGRQDRQGRSLEQQFRDWAGIVGEESAAIVGSAIFGAPDPVAAAREIVEIRDRAVS
jgi:orotidine 5'-phosphate decarboxylase subfamily 1